MRGETSDSAVGWAALLGGAVTGRWYQHLPPGLLRAMSFAESKSAMSTRRHQLRALMGAGLTTSAVAALALAGPPAVSAAGDAAGDSLLPRPVPAERALDLLDGSETATVAARADWSVPRLVEESTDRTLWVDTTGRLFYVDPAASDRSAQRAPVARQQIVPSARTFELHSRPNADRTIYLDFTGHIVTGTAWNTLVGTDPQTYGAYDSDGDPNSFNAAEKAEIQRTWRRVAEDYKPFDVDVTTAEPAPGRLARTNGADQVYGTRLLVTKGGDVFTLFCGSACGGVAYVDVFDAVGAVHDDHQPGFVFTDGVGFGAKNIAEAASHEVGHNLSLSHDGTSVQSYYAGHGAWAPIMGVGYDRPVSQWSRGEYADANNSQDDLALISANGAPTRADDHGDSIGSATVTTGNRGKAVIESTGDQDVFRIKSTGGSYTVTAKPAGLGANLDIALRLMRPGGSLVAQADPAVGTVNAETATGLAASVTRNLPAGNYFAQIRGAGFGSPATTGYSAYGSLGAFSVRAVH